MVRLNCLGKRNVRKCQNTRVREMESALNEQKWFHTNNFNNYASTRKSTNFIELTNSLSQCLKLSLQTCNSSSHQVLLARANSSNSEKELTELELWIIFLVLSSGLRCTAFAKSFARALDGFSFIQSNISAERVFAGIRTRGCLVRSAIATSVLFSPPSYEERM